MTDEPALRSAAVCAPMTPGHLTFGGVSLWSEIHDVKIPVARMGKIDWNWHLDNPVLGPPAPSVVLEAPGLRVLEYEDGSHLIEQVPDHTAAMSMFSRPFAEIHERG